MHEVAHVASRTLVGVMLTTTRLCEVVDGTQLAPNGPPGVPPCVEQITGLLGVLLVPESEVCVSRQMIVAVFAYNHLFQPSQFRCLHVNVFVEERKVLVEIGLGHFRSVIVERIGFSIGWILVQVRAEHCVGVGGLDVFSRTLFAVATRADFVIE